MTAFDGRTETFRLAANVLIWRRGDLILRFESALVRDEAASVARGLHYQGGQ